MFNIQKFKIQTSPYTPSEGGQNAPIPLWRGQGEVIEFSYSIIQLFCYSVIQLFLSYRDCQGAAQRFLSAGRAYGCNICYKELFAKRVIAYLV